MLWVQLNEWFKKERIRTVLKWITFGNEKNEQNIIFKDALKIYNLKIISDNEF